MADPYRFVGFAKQAGKNIEDYQMKKARRNAFQGLDSTGYGQAMRKLGGAGDIQGLNAMSALQAGEGKQRALAENQIRYDMGLAEKKFEWLKGVIPNVRDEASYQAVLRQHDNIFGVDPEIPRQFDPVYVGGLQQMMSQAQDQYEGLGQGYETYLRANQIPNSPQAYQAYQDNVLAQKKAGRPVTNVNLGLPGQTKGRNKVDEVFASEFVDWNASGGYADVRKQIDQLKEVVTALESGRELTGPVTGSVPEFAQKFLNPEALAVKDAVEEVVQRNLRLVLGAQFTEKEGARLIARAYNPNLSEKENKKRVIRLINQIKTAAQAKESASRYWAKNGTLTGWTGKTYTFDDFLKVNKPVAGETKATEQEEQPTQPVIIQFDAEGNIVK